MLVKRIITLLPILSTVLIAGIMIHAMIRTSDEIIQWPKRLLRFILAILAGLVIFSIIYLVSGELISRLGYTYNDKPLLRLAHLTCVLGVYPASFAVGSIFRSKHAALVTGVIILLGVHLYDKGSYLGRLVFSDPAIPINGDFALTNMALILVLSLIGGEVGLRRGISGLGESSRRHAEEVLSTQNRQS